MSRLHRQLPPAPPPGALEPEELRIIELLAQADAERDYRARMAEAAAETGEAGEDRALRPL